MGKPERELNTISPSHTSQHGERERESSRNPRRPTTITSKGVAPVSAKDDRIKESVSESCTDGHQLKELHTR